MNDLKGLFAHYVSFMAYSHVEVAADARHRVRSCGPSPRVPCNEADAVRSACLKGKKMAIRMKLNTNKNSSVVIFMKSMYVLESKTKTDHRYFFMNKSSDLSF